MDPKIVKMAKEIPARLKDVMNSMFDASEPAFRSGVSTLRQSLARLDHYLAEVEADHLGSTSGRGTTTRVGQGSAPTEKVVRRRRKRGRFAITEFVMNELHAAGKPMRPVELAAKLAEATGRAKDNALSNINTLLFRLRENKMVASSDGWYLAAGSGKSAAAATPPARN